MKALVIKIFFVTLLVIWLALIPFPLFDLVIVYGSELWTPAYISGAIGISLFLLTSFIFTMRKTNWLSKYIQ